MALFPISGPLSFSLFNTLTSYLAEISIIWGVEPFTREWASAILYGWLEARLSVGSYTQPSPFFSSQSSNKTDDKSDQMFPQWSMSLYCCPKPYVSASSHDNSCNFFKLNLTNQVDFALDLITEQIIAMFSFYKFQHESLLHLKTGYFLFQYQLLCDHTGWVQKSKEITQTIA